MKKSILFLFSVCLACVGYSQGTDSVTIAGKIDDYSKFSEHQFVKAAVNDIVVDDQLIFMSPVREDGHFSLKISLDEPQTFYFLYGNQHVTVFAHPGDSLFLAFPAFAFISTSSDTISENFTEFGGANRELNTVISAYVAYQSASQQAFYSSVGQGKEFQHQEYKELLNKHRKARFQLLQQFVTERKEVPDQFLQWATMGIDYGFGNDLLIYWFQHAKDTFPDGWFDFVQELPLDSPGAMISDDYKSYFHHLEMFQQRRFLKTEPMASMLKNKENYIGILMDSIVQNSSGYARELFLTHIFNTAAGHPQARERHMPFLPRYFEQVKDEKCRAHIQKIYGLKQDAAIPANILEMLGRWEVPDSVKEVLPLLLEKHKGKVIVLDFWATWCGPCIGEFRGFYPELVPKFKDDDVVFIFMASTSPKDTWQRMVSEFRFEGEHHLLTNSQYAVLQHLFQISGIPHHVLIDKNGKVVENKISLTEDKIRRLLE